MGWRIVDHKSKATLLFFCCSSESVICLCERHMKFFTYNFQMKDIFFLRMRSGHISSELLFQFLAVIDAKHQRIHFLAEGKSLTEQRVTDCIYRSSISNWKYLFKISQSYSWHYFLLLGLANTFCVTCDCMCAKAFLSKLVLRCV